MGKNESVVQSNKNDEKGERDGRRTLDTSSFTLYSRCLVRSVWKVYDYYTRKLPPIVTRDMHLLLFRASARTVLRVEIISRIRSLSRISNQALMTTERTIAVNNGGERKFSFNWKILSSSHYPSFSSQHTNFPEVRNKTKNSEKLKCVKLLAQSRVKVASSSSYFSLRKISWIFSEKYINFPSTRARTVGGGERGEKFEKLC